MSVGAYALPVAAIAFVGIGAYIVLSNKKKTARTMNVIRSVQEQYSDGVITSDEAPGLFHMIQSGRIHERDMIYRPGST